jgi:hypothetical protein
MKHFGLDADANALALLADSISQNNLGDKVAQMQNQATSSVAFAEGDELTIASGFARVAKMVQLNENGERVTTPYLVFDASIKHTNGTVEDATVSLRQLVQPTIVVADPAGKPITRNQLVKRFGDVAVDYRDTHDSKGDVVTLPCLNNEVKLKIAVGKVWMPDFTSYDRDSRAWTKSTPRESYGYVKA